MLFRKLQNTVVRYRVNGCVEERKLADGLYNMINDHIDAVRSHQVYMNEIQQDVLSVLSLSDAGSLKVALGKIGKRIQSQALAFNDCFSVGPIADIDKPT